MAPRSPVNHCWLEWRPGNGIQLREHLNWDIALILVGSFRKILSWVDRIWTPGLTDSGMCAQRSLSHGRRRKSFKEDSDHGETSVPVATFPFTQGATGYLLASRYRGANLSTKLEREWESRGQNSQDVARPSEIAPALTT